MKSVEKDTTQEAERDAGKEYSKGRKAAADAAAAALTSYFARHEGIDAETRDAIDRAVRTQAGVSHSDGAQWNSSGDGT
ncbi:hypothetical protein K4749_19560 [Streptomyces sp. TRM72054]|uniref:hypothetical protein n=1 Tax=Streptomyces sp. TRM72054 TaxID=2870562 RepID=UPI001C8CA4DE|nr:hypothetical protein [Streptomyces sp. TRM72054]MBX9395736.1 hypothetical protein [Streptomyces sp. TRM72054]